MSQMEEKPQTPPNETNEQPNMVAFMAGFREEIGRFVAREQKGYAGMMELKDVNPEELTSKDAKMWHAIQTHTKGSITEVQFEEYRKDVDDSGNASRKAFYGVIANKIQSLLGKEQLDELLAGR